MVEWEDGQLVQGPYVEINGTKYPVVMPEYTGNTPMTAENLNKMQADLNYRIDSETEKFKRNKILWQDDSGSYMNENQTANLTERISDQNTGIVLVFSAYTPGQGSHDYGWYEYFIPKTIVTLKPGGGHEMLIPDNSMPYGARSSKYLYVFDDHINGNAFNVGEHGNLNNSLTVLRYIIGV